MSRNFMNRDFLRWLTTCLLVILAILLLALNLVSFASASGANNPSSGKQSVSSQNQITPAPLSLTLEKTYCQITLMINSDELVNNSQSAITDTENQIKEKSFLKDRQAGLAIIYVNDPNPNPDSKDKSHIIATKIYNILDMLGGENFVFMNTFHLDPLFPQSSDYNHVVLDVYLFFKQAGQTTDTCDSSSHQPKK